jgi:hypothetical protein
MFILTFQGLEYLSIWTLFIKICISWHQINLRRAEVKKFETNQESSVMTFEEGLKDPINKFLYLMLIIVIAFIATHHVLNEAFFRKFLKIWEDNVKEDFFEEFTKGKKKRCCFEITFFVRYFNYHEWISLWRMKGMIIPKK